MNLGELPTIPCRSREQWLDECRSYFDRFQTLRRNGVVPYFHLRYIRIRTPNGGSRENRTVGCVVVYTDHEGKVYAGGSFCPPKEWHRFTKFEARARALKYSQQWTGPLKLYPRTAAASEDINPFLGHFPRSARIYVHRLMCDYLAAKEAAETSTP